GMEGLSKAHFDLAKKTNPIREKGILSEIIKGADVFIGVSAPGVLKKENVASMNNGAAVFAMANPIPEIMPDEALAGGAAVVGTGRSDFANQINNVLAFPGIFKGALSVRASDINDEMKMAAVYAIAGLVSDDELSNEYILPKAFDNRIAQAVSDAVADAARKSGVARI
ncbi:MAG: malic enzyme-like NAD(P)-binding protein, partial [Acutalibacteraceae bacterium]|nr:malic enzyme-like NAD(P)-binding protein [Acutalibacteraceae bacterium]